MIINAECLTKRQKRVLFGMLRRFEQQTLGEYSRNRLHLIDCYIINGKPIAFIMYNKHQSLNHLPPRYAPVKYETCILFGKLIE